MWRFNAPRDNKEEQGAQIDLVIDRGDHAINLCEMKFCTMPYVINDKYEQYIRQRIALFREKTKTTKSLVSTFVTTFGVANGMHKSIVGKEIVAKELFS